MSFVPHYRVTPHLLRLLERISALKSVIDNSPVSIAWSPRLLREATSRTAHSSTAIEGNPLTLSEVNIIIDGGTVGHAGWKADQEVRNYVRALHVIADTGVRKKITTRDILNLHQIVGDKDVLDRGPLGAFRSEQVYVGSFVPPPPKQVLTLVRDLLLWLNTEGQELPAVFSSAILHYQFETIHPFGDGNGRVGRLLGTWELYRRNFDAYHIFSVDEVFLENRQRYYKALSNAQHNAKDITGWIEFAVEAVEMTLERVWLRINEVKSAGEGEEVFILPKQERLLSMLRTGSLSIRDIMSALGVTKQGAHYLLKPLIARNLVKRIGGYKSGKYTLITD